MITIIVGKRKRCKSGLSKMLVYDELSGRDKSRYYLAKKDIEELNKNGGNLSLPPEAHVIFANDKTYTHFPDFHAYLFDPNKFAIPNDKYDTIRIMPHGTYIIDECHKYYNSKMKEIDTFKIQAFEISGHYDVNIILIAHRIMQIHKDIRDLADRIIHVDDSEHTYIVNGKKVKSKPYLKLGELIKTEVWGREFDDVADAIAYAESTKRDKKKYGKDFDMVFKGNIRACYDLFNLKSVFEKTVKDFDYGRN